MKKTKYYELREGYFGTAEIDGNQILIYIEQHNPVFFGLIDWTHRVSWCKLFELSDEDRISCDVNGIFAGRCMTLSINTRNMKTFILKKEIDILFNEYVSNKKRIAVRDKMLNEIVDRF